MRQQVSAENENVACSYENQIRVHGFEKVMALPACALTAVQVVEDNNNCLLCCNEK